MHSNSILTARKRAIWTTWLAFQNVVLVLFWTPIHLGKSQSARPRARNYASEIAEQYIRSGPRRDSLLVVFSTPSLTKTASSEKENTIPTTDPGGGTSRKSTGKVCRDASRSLSRCVFPTRRHLTPPDMSSIICYGTFSLSSSQRHPGCALVKAPRQNFLCIRVWRQLKTDVSE